jgi:membrane protein
MEEENKDKLDNKKNVKESVSCDNNEKVKKIDAKSEKEDNKKDKEKETITNEKSIKTNKIKFNILAIFAIIIFSIALTPVTFQNDTYYTIAIGKDIVETGTIDMKDHFSWHEDLEYTYPHWLYDVGTYLVYQLGENIGIGVFTAIYILTVLLSITLGLVIYMACVKISKHHITSFLITMGIMYLLKNFITARAQLVTFILFALTVLFIEEFIASKKKRYAIGLIIISILIANLHVAVWPFYFVLYLPYVAQYMIALISTSKLGYKINKKFKESRLKSLEKAKLNKKEIKDLDEKIEKIKNKIIEIEKSHDKSEKSAEKRRNNPYKIVIEKQDAVKWLILIMVICAFTGLLTPLGDTPYTYLSKTMEGNTMDNISEHQPLTLINNMEMIICIILVLGLITFTDTKIKLCDLFMLGGLLYLSFMSRRQVSMFDIIGGIIFARIVASFFDKYDAGGEEKLLKSINTIYGKAITILVVILISFNILKPKLDDKFVDENTYPVKASDYIIENVDLSTMKIYNEYNYGSYLLFRGIPVFVDSRADLYTPQFNGEKNDDGKYEGKDIFSDYINTSNIGVYYENKFEEYDITHVLIRKNSKLNMFISRNDKYIELYGDNNFVFYQRNED